MVDNEQKKITRERHALEEGFYIGLGLLILILTLMVFINTEENLFCFPLIFGCGALMQYIRISQHRRKRNMIFGIICCILSIVSLIML